MMTVPLSPPKSVPPNSGRQESILIVDDNPANLGVLFDCLDHAGFEVLVAQDGESALQKANYSQPDLILLDVMMPGIDGFETCQRLQENPATQGIPVIFMTALADVADKVKGLSTGAVDYITKPFQQAEVLARLDIHLRLRQLTVSLAQNNQALAAQVEQRRQAEAALQQVNQDLEQAVADRTAKLQQTIAQLQETLQTLEQAQVQMVQVEKMAGLGQMVAGIAHEINNPVNFIHGNLSHAQAYVDDLLEMVQLYREYCPDPGERVIQTLEDLDIDFVVDDLPKLFKSMAVGADRIRDIVVALRTFSHMDEAEHKAVDIHEGIDSTLMILQHRLKSRGDRPRIEVVKTYGELGPVSCYGGPLNQVFMNLLSNAIDALEQGWEDSPSAAPPQLEIHTERLGRDRVKIVIRDNGCGMDEPTQARIFDPFFTTKVIGKGTGMGLSISYQIVVEKHGGTLGCQSQPGQGTAFMIEIPDR
jgi:two-component system NtrC family sensor kinase